MARNNQLKRRPPRVDPRPRLLLVCEGVTEKRYFDGLKQETRNSLLVVVFGDGEVPKTVVEHALREKKAAGDADFQYDEVWCVFDRDDHPKIPDAMQQARDHGFRVAFSNPCFELWLLLHFQDQRAGLHRDQAKRLVNGHIQGYEKAIPHQMLRPRYAFARDRATALRKWQTERGNGRENPWTEINTLTERIYSLDREVQLKRLR